MKHFYSIILSVLFVLIGTSCEDESREIIIFSGDAPIYENGECINLLSSVSLYTNRLESTTVRIDGGDGEYTVLNSDEKVATAALLPAANGYARLQLTRKSLGETLVTVKDGSGKSFVLKVMVSKFRYTWPVTKVGIIIKGTVTPEKKAEIEKAFEGTYPVPVGGRYELYPDSWNASLEQGDLLIYADDTTVAPTKGLYRIGLVSFEGKEVSGFYFTYNNKEHCYVRLQGHLMRDPGPASMTLLEDVTAICLVALPDGVIVYRAQEVGIR